MHDPCLVLPRSIGPIGRERCTLTLPGWISVTEEFMGADKCRISFESSFIHTAAMQQPARTRPGEAGSCG